MRAGIREVDVDSAARRWAMIWGTWITAFAIAEYQALRTGQPEAPLSYHARYVLGVRHESPVRRRVGQIALVSGTAWLAAHLAKGAEQ